ncbi:MAG: hypothetical protein ACF8QF_01585, partial [Phycisphaerales bacterium]
MFRSAPTALPRLIMLLAFALLLGGCTCAGPTARPIQVGLDPELRSAQFRTIEVDLVFVQENQLSLWRDKDMIDYFSGGDSLRRDESRKTTLVFTPGGATDQSYGVERPQLEQIGQWIKEGATHLFVMAKLPEHERIGRRSGPADPRRQSVALSGCAWDEAGGEHQDIRVTVRRGRVRGTPSGPAGQ